MRKLTTRKEPSPAQVFARKRNMGKGQIIGVKHMIGYIMKHCPLDFEHEKMHLLKAYTLLGDALYNWEDSTTFLKAETASK